jgi:iron complex outermembrane receptor protein
MVNKGVELTVGAMVLQTAELNWNVGFNITWQSTEITKLSNQGDYMDVGEVQLNKVGYAPNSFYTYRQIYNSNGNPMQNVLADSNHDGEITNADKYISGKKPTPDVFFGLNTKLNYKKWDFGFNAHASFGNWMFNQYYAAHSTPNGSFLGLNYLTNMPVSVKKTGFTETNSDAQQRTDFFLEDASFFRMDDITAGYRFDNIANTKLTLRIAFTVQNVFVITGYSGLDPEISGGIDNNIWPRPRIFSLRMGLTF